MATAATVKECDYVGIVSGNTEPDKIKKAGWTVSKSDFVDAPVINELPMVIECEVAQMSDDSDYIVGNIINVSAGESVLTDGKIDASKLQPICYDPVSHNYNVLGPVAGKAFSDGKAIK
jgi:flavin reductase (DIM6/NTAB) family NADH-FMN oxidoreductase RutF